MNIKSICLSVCTAMISLPCFAGTTFYCPLPSSIHAQSATYPYPEKPGYNYVGYDASGIEFSSIIPIIGNVETAPQLVTLDSASWWDVNNGMGQCFYRDQQGNLQAVVARISESFTPVGGSWTNFPNGQPGNVCNSDDISLCPFEIAQ